MSLELSLQRVVTHEDFPRCNEVVKAVIACFAHAGLFVHHSYC